MGPGLFDMNLGFSGTNDLVTPLASPSIQAKSSPLLTTAAVQQAAAALNIPWSHDLELAVLAQAQAVGHTIPSLLPVDSTPAMIIPKMEPVEQTVVSVPTGNKKRAISPEEEQDEIVAKRAKNTDAARRSRMKKLVRLETLEAKVAELEATNNRLTMKVAILETEKNGHLAKDADQSVRIAQLEAKLAEAHAALTSRA
jgi:hypothetical protein